MPDNNIIHQLSSDVINQIAAGEVVQRPASVVKELVENSIDAGATKIDIIIKDAGRTLVQVIDNGKGMSADDSITAFERHATSKISDATDLYNLHTMGFRGEALASIAAIAHIEMKTRRAEDELGSRVAISAGEVEEQEMVSCPAGTQISVRDIFYNIPVRRKFLKSNETELRNIISVFEQITLVYPSISFTLRHGDAILYQLLPGTRMQRITALFGKKCGQQLIPLEAETTIIRISGYIGNTDTAAKRNQTQFFFVNGRYIQHPYFAKAIMNAYDKIIPTGYRTSFFVYLDVDPANIDVNIHPTKTEVKFENENAIFPIIHAVVREAINKADLAPAIDFDQTDAPEIPVIGHQPYIEAPKVTYDTSYNPFKNSGGQGTSYQSKSVDYDWTKLYSNNNATEKVKEEEPQLDIAGGSDATYAKAFQMGMKYIVYPSNNGIVAVNQHRAHARVIFDRTMANMNAHRSATQTLLFPLAINLSAREASLIDEMMDELTGCGFAISKQDNNTYMINGTPAQVQESEAEAVIRNAIEAMGEETNHITDTIRRGIALSIARNSSIKAGRRLEPDEIRELLTSLSACSDHRYDPNGAEIATTIPEAEIAKTIG